MILLNNRDIQEVLTAEMTLAALEKSYRDLIDEEAVCRPRVDGAGGTSRASDCG